MSGTNGTQSYSDITPDGNLAKDLRGWIKRRPENKSTKGAAHFLHLEECKLHADLNGLKGKELECQE